MTVFEDTLRARVPVVVLEETHGDSLGVPAEIVISTPERDALADAIEAARRLNAACEVYTDDHADDTSAETGLCSICCEWDDALTQAIIALARLDAA